jgi:hypothetical protein
MAQRPGSVEVVVTVTVQLSLWGALKLRLAGRELREKMTDEILLRTSSVVHPEDRR